MKRLVLAFAIGLPSCPTAAPAQQPVPMQAICVPAQPVLDDVQAGAASMRQVFIDAEGDGWFVVTRTSDGASAIGWISVPRGLFCVVAGGPPQSRGSEPGRGA